MQQVDEVDDETVGRLSVWEGDEEGLKSVFHSRHWTGMS